MRLDLLGITRNKAGNPPANSPGLNLSTWIKFKWNRNAGGPGRGEVGVIKIVRYLLPALRLFITYLVHSDRTSSRKTRLYVTGNFWGFHVTCPPCSPPRGKQSISIRFRDRNGLFDRKKIKLCCRFVYVGGMFLCLTTLLSRVLVVQLVYARFLWLHHDTRKQRPRFICLLIIINTCIPWCFCIY